MRSSRRMGDHGSCAPKAVRDSGETPGEYSPLVGVDLMGKDAKPAGCDNVIPAKAGIQAPGLFLVLKTTPDKTHVVPVERVPEKTGKWNPGPCYRHINHAGHRRGASGFRPPACAGAGFAGMTWGG